MATSRNLQRFLSFTDFTRLTFKPDDENANNGSSQDSFCEPSNETTRVIRMILMRKLPKWTEDGMLLMA
jgi:hypothetical protein